MRTIAELYVHDPLTERETLDALQAVLLDVLPTWSKEITVAKNEDVAGEKLEGKGSLFKTVQAVAPVKWGFNSVLLTGSYDGLTLCLHGCRTGVPPELNRISVELIDLEKVEERPSSEWLRSLFERVTSSVRVRYGYACVNEEFESKNMIRDEQGVRAVGVNLANALPGVYWLNFFGEPYISLIGIERLKTVPAHEVREGHHGILVLLDDNPHAWATDSYRKGELAAIEHLGTQYFFSKLQPGKETIAARFDKSKASR